MAHATPLLTALALAAAAATAAPAQTAQLPPDTLPLADLSALRARGAGAGWRVAGGAAADRQRALALSATAGSGVLVSLAPPGQGTDLLTAWEHGDLELELEVMIPKGSSSGVYLQGRYEVQIHDSWGVRRPTFADMGGIAQRWDARRGAGHEGFEGMAPRQNAGRAPGLWQTLKVQFRAPRFDSAGRKTADARFVRVELNGVVIHENVRVTGPTRDAAFQDERPAGPLLLQGDQGPVAFRRIRFKRFAGQPVRLSALRYRAYQGEFARLEDATAGAPLRQGAADGISSALAGAPDKFALTFDGTIEVPASATYLFELGFDWVDDDPQFKGTVVGGGRLAVDGREVLRHEGRLPSASGAAPLSSGTHALSLTYYKMRPWTSRAAASLWVEAPGVERQTLHAERTPDVAGAITVEPDGGEPLVLRSFVLGPGGQGKRTHAASVGDPAGVHYSVDLARGALLSAWRGPFAETTDMWHERGNAQLLRPLGSVLELAGAPPLAFLPDDSAPWPDSVAADDDFAFRGYALEAGGRPAFLYRLRGVELEDRLRPAEDGASLRRELRLRAPDATGRLFVRLASGREIRALPDGSYLVDDARYYVALDRGAPKATVRSAPGGGRELLLPVHFRGGEATVAYTLIW